MGGGHRGVASAEDRALRGRNLSADTGQIHEPHRYHAGLKAGQPSQAGIITTMRLRSVVEKNGYHEFGSG